MHDNQLEKFQSLLLETLYLKTEFKDMDMILHSSETSLPFLPWLNQIEPHMLELGAGIVKKYGSKE